MMYMNVVCDIYIYIYYIYHSTVYFWRCMWVIFHRISLLKFLLFLASHHNRVASGGILDLDRKWNKVTTLTSQGDYTWLHHGDSVLANPQENLRFFGGHLKNPWFLQWFQWSHEIYEGPLVVAGCHPSRFVRNPWVFFCMASRYERWY